MVIWMRCNFILNSTQNYKDEEINWEKVNEILHSKSDILYDYNIFSEITSREELLLLRENAICASLGYGPFHKKKCKACGNDFYLNFGEIEFFQNKGLKMPCRCIYCRKGIERPKPITTITPKVESEEPVKTAM